MLMALGPIAFEVAPMNVHGVDYSAETVWVEKPVAGAEPPLEFVGEGANAWTLVGRLFPHKFGGLDDLGRLHQARASGLPQYALRGDGKPLGWVVIERVTERSTYLDRQGVGQQIDFEVQLRRAHKPTDGAFFAIVSGFL